MMADEEGKCSRSRCRSRGRGRRRGLRVGCWPWEYLAERSLVMSDNGVSKR